MRFIRLLLELIVGSNVFTVCVSLNLCWDALIVSQGNVISVNNHISVLTNLNRMECISKCAFHQSCMTVFHRETSKDCVLYSQHMNNLALVTLLGWRGFEVGTLDDNTRQPSTPQVMTQLWVSSVPAFSSEYTNEVGFKATEIIGANDLYPDYGDDPGAWASAEHDQGPEWIQVRFPEPLYIRRVDIYETYKAGGTKSVAVKNGGAWDTVWTNPQLQVIVQSRINSINLQIDYASDEIKITVDPSLANKWVELDAVKLIGWPTS